VAGSDGGGGDAEKPVSDVVNERRGVRTAASPAEQRQGLPQHSLGEDDQHLSALQSRQRTRLLQGPSKIYSEMLTLATRACNAWFPSLHDDAPHRTAIPPALADLQTCNSARILLLQALALRTVFATFFVERKMLVVRCIALR